jgi:hypothetical protein
MTPLESLIRLFAYSLVAYSQAASSIDGWPLIRIE